jgi:hypothetical protein
MKKQINIRYDNIISYLVIVILCWISITCVIQAFYCPKMTRIEKFLHIPKSVMLKFEHCKYTY